MERVREIANLMERKNPHTPVYGVEEFVCLSVINFDPNYLRTGRTEWAEFFLGHLWQKDMSQNFLFFRKVADRARTEGRISYILSQYFNRLAWDRAKILIIKVMSTKYNTIR